MTSELKGGGDSPAALTTNLQRGRPFKPGQSGNPAGRRPGSKGRLTDVFVSAIADDFAEHGPGVIARVRCGDPVAYLKIIGALVPREMVLQRERDPTATLSEISLSEFLELLEERRRQASIRNALLAAERG